MIVSKSKKTISGVTLSLALALMASSSVLASGLLAPQDVVDDKIVKDESSDKKTSGPSVGKPANIVPGPYFAKGTIQLPPKPDSQDTDPLEAEGSLITAAQQELARPVSRDPIIEDALIQLDPSGIAATDEDSIASPIFWGAYDRETIEGFINGLHPTGPLPTVHNLAEKLIRAAQILPAPSGDEDVIQFIKTRLSALRRFGDGASYVSLINRLPTDHDWSPLARFSAEAALVSGKMVQACTIAAEHGNETSQPYWLKMNALCYAIDGNRTGVDFQISILEETTTISPVFYKLIDQILIEAEQASAVSAGEQIATMAPIDIFEPFPVSILEASMARLTSATISDLSVDAPDPLAIPILISQPGLSREARIELVELGVKQNWLDAGLLQEFIATLDISAEEEDLAYQLYDTDDRFLIDLSLARQIANKDQPADDRLQAFKLATDRAARQNTTPGLAALHLSLIDDITPNTDILDYAATIGRLSLLTNNYQLASRWFTLSRSLPVGSNPASDSALLALWPLMIVAGQENDIPAVNTTSLQHWWTALEGDTTRFDKANRLFSVLEGLSYTISDEAWQWLEAGPSGVSGKAISPAHWRRFLIASSKGQQIDVQLSLLPLFENDEAIEPALLGSVIGNLKARGEEMLARRIALESLLHAGL